MQIRWLVAVVWTAFVLRGALYCAVFPLWEGFDEWAHFGVVQRVAQEPFGLVSRDAKISPEIHASLELGPVAWEMRGLAPWVLPYEAWWRLPETERARRAAALRALPSGAQPTMDWLTAYEGLQAPLYYWVIGVLLKPLTGASLITQVYWARLLSVLLASLTVPLAFVLARKYWRDDGPALQCVCLIAVMPGLFIDVCRVGNDALAVPMFTLVILATISFLERTQRTAFWSIGIALGFGLLTKAYVLTAVPVVAGVLLFRRRSWRGPAVAGGTALAISGWWYLRNRLTTGTWSGLGEAVLLRDRDWHAFLDGAVRVDWRNAIDSILHSHLWFGAWSSLTVRSWMYHFLYAVILVGLVGLVVAIRRGPQRAMLVSLFSFVALFWAGQAYNVVLLFLTKGASTSMGWYLYAVVAAEVVLIAAGLEAFLPRRPKGWSLIAGTAAFALLDFYTLLFVLTPYYTGLTSHGPNGAVKAVRLHDMAMMGGELIDRLALLKPPFLAGNTIGFLVAAYLVSTIGLVVLAGWVRSIARLAPGEGESAAADL